MIGLVTTDSQGPGIIELTLIQSPKWINQTHKNPKFHSRYQRGQHLFQHLGNIGSEFFTFPITGMDDDRSDQEVSFDVPGLPRRYKRNAANNFDEGINKSEFSYLRRS